MLPAPVHQGDHQISPQTPRAARECRPPPRPSLQAIPGQSAPASKETGLEFVVGEEGDAQAVFLQPERLVRFSQVAAAAEVGAIRQLPGGLGFRRRRPGRSRRNGCWPPKGRRSALAAPAIPIGSARKVKILLAMGSPMEATGHSRLPMAKSASWREAAKDSRGSPLRRLASGPSSSMMSPTKTKAHRLSLGDDGSRQDPSPAAKGKTLHRAVSCADASRLHQYCSSPSRTGSYTALRPVKP